MKHEDRLTSGAHGRIAGLLTLLVMVTMAPLAADGHAGQVWPESSGVYFENNSQHDWVPIRAEQAKMAALTAKGEVTEAKLARGYSRATLYAPMKVAVRVNPSEEITAYRVYRLRSCGDARQVRFNKPVAVEWREIGPDVYELQLPADLAAGDYAVLPPADGAERVYAFRYEPLRLPRSQGLAFR